MTTPPDATPSNVPHAPNSTHASKGAKKSGPPTPTSEGWDRAVTTFERWIGPIGSAPLQTAKQRYFAFSRPLSEAPGFIDAAPMLAFGFLTRAAFDDALRKTRIYR